MRSYRNVKLDSRDLTIKEIDATVNCLITYLFLFLPVLALFCSQPSCVLGPYEKLTILYTGDVLGKIEPCG